MSLYMTCVTVLCVLGISIGQLLFKQAAVSIRAAHQWQDWLLNGWLIAALVLYGLTTLAWIWVLRETPLRLAYPFMGLAFLIVPVMSWLFLGEQLRGTTLAGGALILVGVALAAQPA
jgi:drug/metabolite transporter (DMT)-like permease